MGTVGGSDTAQSSIPPMVCWRRACRCRGPAAPTPPPPLCDIPSGCCFFRGLCTVTHSSLCMLHWVAAFCQPLRPVYLLVSVLHWQSPVVGILGLYWLLQRSFLSRFCPLPSAVWSSTMYLAVLPQACGPSGCCFFTLRGPGQSPVLPCACCVGSLYSDGRCGLCSCWCCFRVSGAQEMAHQGCAGWCGGRCGGRFTVFAAHSPPHSGRPPHASPCFRVRAVQHFHPSIRGPGGPPCASPPRWPARGAQVCMARSLMVAGGMRFAGGVCSLVADVGGVCTCAALRDSQGTGGPAGPQAYERSTTPPPASLSVVDVWCRGWFTLHSDCTVVISSAHPGFVKGSLRFDHRADNPNRAAGVPSVARRARYPLRAPTVGWVGCNSAAGVPPVSRRVRHPLRTTHKIGRCPRIPSGGPLGAGSPGHVQSH